MALLPKSLRHDDYTELTDYLITIQSTLHASAAAGYIIKDNKVIYERYFGRHSHEHLSREVDAYSQFNVASIRKTYLALIVSRAIHEGKIQSLDQAVTDFISVNDIDSLDKTTIRHVLTHTHGLTLDDRAFIQGTSWLYNNVGVNLLIKIIESIYGRSYTELLQEYVFNPYGFSETGWHLQADSSLIWLNEQYNTDYGSEANLFVSTRELAFWGYLHLTKGLVNGKRYIAPEVFEQAVSIISPPINSKLPRNGFFWFVQDRPRLYTELGEYVPEGSFQSLGMTGCACLVIPKLNVVAVRMLNQVMPNPDGYNYLEDIKAFGNLVYKLCVKEHNQ